MSKKQTPYAKCKSKLIDSYMKKFERGELKSGNNSIIKNRLQAVAMALSISEKACEKKITKADIEDKEEKVHKMLYAKDNELLSTKLQLSNVKNAMFLMDYYKKKRSTAKLHKLESELLSRAVLAAGEGNLTANVYKDLKKYIKARHGK